MKIHKFTLPLDPEQIASLEIGDKVLLSGVIYTARDQAHKRMLKLLAADQDLAFDLRETAIFYCGPSPKAEGQVCGAIGPNTSSRMDKLTVPLLEAGLKVMIGKGERNSEVNEAIHEHGAVYLTAIGGVSAVLSRCIVSCETFLWPDLGAEAVYRLSVIDLPCYVATI
ncbi:MAG TPA: FumA C-terminus/TtdB family hydratase beta subunit [Candidatus Cloacimonadota bacterium]|nr:FumA C-terminus/TtdB family hydratase beta subunit [Candidatus Cloacimonadota bacterium]